MDICKNCGATLNENKFCIRCGSGGDGIPLEKGIGQQYSTMDEELKIPKRRIFEESELVYSKPDFGMKFHTVYVIMLGLHLLIGFTGLIKFHIGYIILVAFTILLLFMHKKIGYFLNMLINIFYLVIGILSFVMGITLLTGFTEYKVICDILETVGLFTKQGIYALIFGLVLTIFSIFIMKYYNDRKIVFK